MVVIHNASVSGVSVSGGRYHGLLLAKAILRAGHTVTILTDSVPALVAEIYPPGTPRPAIIVDPQFQANLRFDVVILVPTGSLNPPYYACVERLARRSGRAPVVINFESANWYNTAAPTPDYHEVWDGWRRVIVHGGLVLSSSVVSDRYARSFYQADDGPLAFAVCPPPINSELADRVPVPKKGGSIVYFARPFNAHKGGQDVLLLPPQVWADRRLDLIFGGAAVDDYVEQVAGRISMAERATLRVHSCISDEEKFRLLGEADVLLFPSWFEGYGYPPVEAAYMGTEIVCYDLPVLRETLGSIAHFAPLGNVDGLAQALSCAFARRERRDTLKAAVAARATVEEASVLVGPLLEALPGRSADGATGGAEILWGPWSFSDCSLPPDRDGEIPPMPAFGTISPQTRGGDFTVTLVTWTRGRIRDAHLVWPDTRVDALVVRQTAVQNKWRRHEIMFDYPFEQLGRHADLRLSGDRRESTASPIGLTMRLTPSEQDATR